jgi:2-(1,2-epoxy-1,2-dihydrophenyl)acetyl-CoA isomerase
LTPDGSSTYFLAKHVGLLRAKELQMTNRMLTAEEACDWGMVSRVVPHDDLMDEAMKMARKFAGGPTAAYGGVKRLALTAFSGEMEAQLDKESISISSLMRGHDAPHGIKSFLHKEKPDFEGS